MFISKSLNVRNAYSDVPSVFVLWENLFEGIHEDPCNVPSQGLFSSEKCTTSFQNFADWNATEFTKGESNFVRHLAQKSGWGHAKNKNKPNVWEYTQFRAYTINSVSTSLRAAFLKFLPCSIGQIIVVISAFYALEIEHILVSRFCIVIYFSHFRKAGWGIIFCFDCLICFDF